MAERRNRALMDIATSMMSTCHLLESLLDEALKTVAYILTRVPNKSILKTLSELWTNRKPCLNHFSLWGCLAEVKIHILQRKETDPRSTRY